MFVYNFALPISAITDGTSTTMMFGERANGKFTAAVNQNSYCWWPDSVTTDTIFTTLYPLNPFTKVAVAYGEVTSSWVSAASSFHPGGPTSLSPTDRSVSSRTRSRPGRSTPQAAILSVRPTRTDS
jgi:hypothetical protein